MAFLSQYFAGRQKITLCQYVYLSICDNLSHLNFVFAAFMSWMLTAFHISKDTSTPSVNDWRRPHCVRERPQYDPKCDKDKVGIIRVEMNT